MYDEASRKQKALRALAIFLDYKDPNTLTTQTCLEVGSSTGIMTFFLADHFQKVIGIDIDRPALEFAKNKYSKANIDYFEMDALHTTFPDNHFDHVVCHHTYEHVADSQLLIDEIYRILKPGGLLYFGAPNRLMIKESHYQIYFLSWLPKGLASWIVRICKKGDDYYETMLTYWGIKRLFAKNWQLKDYTLKCILEPEKYYATDVMEGKTWIKRIPTWLLKRLIPFSPDLVLLARKES